MHRQLRTAGPFIESKTAFTVKHPSKPTGLPRIFLLPGGEISNTITERQVTRVTPSQPRITISVDRILATLLPHQPGMLIASCYRRSRVSEDSRAGFRPRLHNFHAGRAIGTSVVTNILKIGSLVEANQFVTQLQAVSAPVHQICTQDRSEERRVG